MKVKKVMQADPEVGKMTAQASVLVAKVAELFLKEMAVKCEEYANVRFQELKTIDNSILKGVVDDTQGYEFLKPLIDAEPVRPVRKPKKGVANSQDKKEQEAGNG